MLQVDLGGIGELSPRSSKSRVSCRELQRGEGSRQWAAREEAAQGIKALGAWSRWVLDHHTQVH